ncbi:MAG: DUF309 domain-containing protein [Candidatus Omnitrophica bacterium]|nr:DUF309 domain-containing protein [Candidatus Omnitrophota bacterium]
MKQEPRSIPRLIPSRAFPSYAFVPGLSAHPTHNPQGHSYNRVEEEIEAPDPKRWKNNEHYLYGIDLFNYGYYWEAHEIWEDLWNADGRIGLPSDFLKGLIKLAAAGVKAREGVRRGLQAHARGAALLFEAVLSKQTGPDARYMGLSLKELHQFARSLAKTGAPLQPHTDDADPIVFDLILSPQ